jgi:hypothetical protein
MRKANINIEVNITYCTLVIRKLKYLRGILAVFLIDFHGKYEVIRETASACESGP